MNYSQTEQKLYGGAMSVVLPPQFVDVSCFREIPDNQEVFANSLTDQSIIVDILEYITEPDQQAIQSHFQEVADSNGASNNEITKIISVNEIPKDEISMPECEKVYYILGQQQVAKYNETAKNIINLHLGLFRLPMYTTDILVTFNDPINISPESSSHKPVPTSATRWTDSDFKHIIKSLQILDTGLFGQ
ncbi:hypothetical protein SNE40_014618 [Patella caerulea]|uniref:Ran guanine nucleotide release factor n=1 Tax=Patella caerulea TaxID=87958 RepID=A0AAN8JID5_PATCE